MIYDNIRNIKKYKNNSKLYAALIALEQYVAGTEYDERSIASFHKMDDSTRLWADANMENHHQYVDIHYVIEGSEKILISDSKTLKRLSEFSQEKDCELFEIPHELVEVTLKEGDFLVVYPGESHAPKIAVDNVPKMISKVVAKYA